MSEEIVINEKDLLELMEQAFDEGNRGYVDTRDSTVYSILEEWKLKHPSITGNGTGSCLPKWNGNTATLNPVGNWVVDNTWSTSNIVVNVGNGEDQLRANLSMEAAQDLFIIHNINVMADVARFYAGYRHPNEPVIENLALQDWQLADGLEVQDD